LLGDKRRNLCLFRFFDAKFQNLLNKAVSRCYCLIYFKEIARFHLDFLPKFLPYYSQSDANGRSGKRKVSLDFNSQYFS